MPDNHMLYESIILAAWDKTWRREDPFKLGDAGTLGAVDNELRGQNGHDAKFALSAALRKVAAEKDEIYDVLMELDSQVWNANVYNDIVIILPRIKDIFEKAGIIS